MIQSSDCFKGLVIFYTTREPGMNMIRKYKIWVWGNRVRVIIRSTQLWHDYNPFIKKKNPETKLVTNPSDCTFLFSFHFLSRLLFFSCFNSFNFHTSFKYSSSSTNRPSSLSSYFHFTVFTPLLENKSNLQKDPQIKDKILQDWCSVS